MKPKRLHWVFVVVGVLVLSAYWVVRAQEGRPYFPPPTVLPKDDGPAPKPAKQQGAGEIVQATAQLPPPTFPPTLPQVEDKGPAKLPPLAVPEPPLVGFPPPEPTKALIAEPSKNTSPEAQPAPIMLPPPVVLPDAKKGPEIPPPAPPIPTVTMEPKTDPVIPPTLVIPEPRMDADPTKATPPAPVNPDPPPARGTKAFVRILRTSDPLKVGTDFPPPPPAISPPPGPEIESPATRVPAFPPTSVDPVATSLQTPSVTVDKRGPKSMRANETQIYQIVVRNVGPGVAQQIRVEDDLPAGVKIIAAEPMPTIEGSRAIWVLSTVNANQDQTIRLTLQASGDAEISGRTGVHVSAMTQPITTVRRASIELARPQPEAASMVVKLTGPNLAEVGKEVTFDIHITNQSSQPLTGMVLHGYLPEGLTNPAGNEIEGHVDGVIAPGEIKILKMPATAVKPGHHTASVKVVTNAGEATATSSIDIAAAAASTPTAPLLQQVPSARLSVGRDGELRIELTNNTGKPLRNVTVADRLPEGLDFVGVSNGGLYQGNSRIVYWLIANMPVGKSETLIVRVNGIKAGQLSHVAFAKADGVPEAHLTGAVSLEGHADLTVRVAGRDAMIEQGRETTYDIVVQNPGSAPARNVQLQVQLSPGLTAKTAQGSSRFAINPQTVRFDTIPLIEAKGQAVFRVSAVGQSVGEQRVTCAIVSDEVRVPIQRDASIRVVEK